MKDTSLQGTIEITKKIVNVLNELKFQNYTFCTISDLMVKLKSKNCPYAAPISSYLRREGKIVGRGGWYVFADKVPFQYFNFICVVERAKNVKNKSAKNIRKENLISKPTENSSIVDPPKEIPKWKRFLIKLLFGIVI